MKNDPKQQKTPADQPGKRPSKSGRSPSPKKRKNLAIGYKGDDEFACSANVVLDPSTVGPTPCTECEAAQSAADQLFVLCPALDYFIDRLWLVEGSLQAVGDWRRDEDFVCPDLDGVEIEFVKVRGKILDSLRCQACGEVWQPHVGDDGRLPEDFAICPKNCNRQK
jgi:hypothetical protein